MCTLLGLFELLIEVFVLNIHAYGDSALDLSLEPREVQITMLEVVFNTRYVCFESGPFLVVEKEDHFAHDMKDAQLVIYHES